MKPQSNHRSIGPEPSDAKRFPKAIDKKIESYWGAVQKACFERLATTYVAAPLSQPIPQHEFMTRDDFERQTRAFIEAYMSVPHPLPQSKRTRHERLKIARFAIEFIAPRVRAIGQYNKPQPKMPGHWELIWQGLQLILTEHVLLAPDDPATASMIDILGSHGKKVLSVRWHPSQPWLPPTVVNFKPGEWTAVMEKLCT